MMRGVSVVIPVYNRSSLVERTLDSVAAQTRKPERLIVVDNGSTDDTAQTVRRWMDRHADTGIDFMLLSEPKKGASAARNRGLEAVETEYVSFFDSDDEMHPRLVEEAMKGVGTADLIYWKGVRLELDGSRFAKPFYTDNLVRRQFYNAVLSTQCFMARTELIREIGGWNEEASVWNDWELGLRIAYASPRTVAIDETLVTIYAQKESITGSRLSEKAGEWENTLDIVERVIQNGDKSQQKRLLDMVDYRRAILAAHYLRENAYANAVEQLDKALSRPRPAWRRLLLKTLYRYTAKGGRAAYYLWRY